MNKIEGKVGDFCPNCKNCKGITKEYDGKTASIRLTEVKCEDPHDGMVKILNADSDICCSMFELANKEELEARITDLTDTNNKLMERNVELIAQCDETYEEYRNCKKILNELEKIDAKNKDIDILLDENKRLKLRNDNQVTMIQGLKLQYNDLSEKLKKEQESGSNIVEENVKLEKEIDNLKELIKASKRKDELIQDYREKLKKADELANSWKRDYYRIREQFLCPIYDILYPDNPNLDINVTALLDDVKNLKIYAGENKSMQEDLKYWMERCHKAETDVTIMNSKVEVFEKKFRKADSIRDAVWNEKELKQKISDLETTISSKNKDIDTLLNENISLNTINKGIAEDRKKLINYMRSLKIASENYLKGFTYEEESDNE